MEEFSCGTKLIVGWGSACELGRQQCGSMLVVTDSLYASEGLAERVAAAAGADQWEVFDRVTPQPDAELVSAGAARLREMKPEAVLALGDEDVIDLAKAMVFFSGGTERLTAIPTVLGSGSQVTGKVTLHHGQQHRVLECERMMPRTVVLDGRMLERLPVRMAFEGGFEAISRAVEGFTARDAGLFARTMAKESLMLLLAGLPRFSSGEDNRQRLLSASTMAALSVRQTGGLCSAMVECLHRSFPVSRGRLCAVLLPAVMELNAYASADPCGLLARAVGAGGSGQMLRQRIIRLRRELKLPENLIQTGIEPGTLWNKTGQLVEQILSVPELRWNPVRVEDFMVRRILEQVTGR